MLHPEAKNRLLEELKKALPTLAVRRGLFIDSFIAYLALHKAEQVIPKSGRLRGLYEQWIDDTPVATFIGGRLREELRLRSKYDSDNELTNLAELEGFGDTDSLAASFVEEFESLPFHYTLTMRFPEALPTFPKDRTAVQLGSHSRLALCDLFFREAYLTEHENKEVRDRISGRSGILLGVIDDFNWTDDATYFQVEAAGYIDPYGSGSQFDEANRALRRFVGLGLGLKLFTYLQQYKPIPTKHFWIIHTKYDNQWRIHDRIDMDGDDAVVLDGLKLWNGFAPSYPEEQRVPWLQSVLMHLGEVLSAPATTNVGLAAEWFFDSFKGRDETLTYVRRMTCIEILCGEHADTSKVSLGELLGNRLAYLIGRSHADREKVLKEFRSIYSLRSRILHHGKHRFSSEERGHLWMLRRFCERALEAEAKMLTADAGS